MRHDTKNLAAVLTELALLPLRIGLSAFDALSELRHQPRVDDRSEATLPAAGEAEIEAAALAIRSKLTEGHDVGFQDMLRTNLPDDVIAEVAKAALEAARKARAKQ